MGALETKRRATGRAHAGVTSHVCNLKQSGGTKTGDWIGYLHWLTLKNPARHRNPQCRITQMPDFHKSLPTPDLSWGEITKVPL